MIRRLPALALVLTLAASPPLQAAPPTGATLQSCVLGASEMHGVPPSAMILLLMVEGGRLGMRSQNTNGTGDLGPFQVNEIWLPRIARYWDVPEAEALALVRDDLCSNAEAAAWIFGDHLRELNGDVWGAVARYHSRRPDLQGSYLSKAYKAAQRLRSKVPHG